VSDYMLKKPLLNPVPAKEDESHFLRGSQELTGQARPRTFGAYMGQRQQGGRTRLQELRAKHGWSHFGARTLREDGPTATPCEPRSGDSPEEPRGRREA